MKTSIRNKLDRLAERFEEVTILIASPQVQADQAQFRNLSREYAQLSPLVNCYQKYRRIEMDMAAAEELRQEPEMAELADEEVATARRQLEEQEPELLSLLLPPDPDDERNVFLEVRAGTGGAEAAIFAGDLFRMYSRYAETRGWQVEILSESLGEHGGYKEIISLISGRGAYFRLKFEAGTHRVQRVPETEAQGRIPPSACTLAILPEAAEIDAIDINTDDLRIDTYRSSGAGGQHVNKTESAVRITHMPSGIVVECQDERSQHKNKARAMSLLQARLLRRARESQVGEQALSRKLQVGSGDRSERIRTYNFPQNRLTEHRINLTLYQLDLVMQGQLDMVIDPLHREYQAEQLAALADAED